MSFTIQRCKEVSKVQIFPRTRSEIRTWTILYLGLSSLLPLKGNRRVTHCTALRDSPIRGNFVEAKTASNKNCLGCSQIEICMPLPRTRREILPSSLMRWSTHTHGPTFTHPHTHKQIHPYAHTRSRAHAPFHSKTKKNFATSILLCSLSDGACSNQPFMPEDYYDLLDLTLIHSQQTVCRTNGDPYVDLFRERQKLKHFRCSKKPPI